MDKKKRLILLSVVGLVGIGIAAVVVVRDSQAWDDFDREQAKGSPPIVREPLPPPRSQEGSVTRALTDLRAEIKTELAQFDLIMPGEGVDPDRKKNLLAQIGAARAATISRFTRAQLKGMLQLLRKMLTDETNPAIGLEEESAKLSWRVHFLPLLGHQDLYDQFHLDEPWDSPHNMTLLPKMPLAYRHYDDDESTTRTRFLAISGSGFLSNLGRLQPMSAVTDLESETIAVVVAGSEAAVPWTSPQDLSLDTESYSSIMTQMPKPVFLIGTIEGAALRVRFDGSFDVFRALATISGGEPGALDAMHVEASALMKSAE